MQDINSMIASLKRPMLLVTAARLGLADYRRRPVLSRLLGQAEPPRPAEAAMALMDLERSHDIRRKSGDPAYSPLRHLDVLIALMGEARQLQLS